jgi:putative endonuclease
MSRAPPRLTRDRAGRRAETVATWWLRLRGFGVLTTRWRTKVGEIDLVARRGDLVVFVEVKRRATLAAAAEAVTASNRARVVRAAEHYLAGRPDLATCRVRFDAVLLAPWSVPRHVEGAWDAGGTVRA